MRRALGKSLAPKVEVRATRKRKQSGRDFMIDPYLAEAEGSEVGSLFFAMRTRNQHAVKEN